MQALTGQTLQQLNVQTFDDYIKYLPNVTSASNGPGQNEVFMRGLSAGSQASQGSGSTGVWPNVAIYLDNQSGQLPSRNLDIYAADLNRIEVLEGPQGTLFGAGAEAGAIRYITNEPKLNVTEGSITGGYGTTAHGDPNSNLTAVLNVPLIPDTMAVRAVIYDDQRGGYIDNVPATFTRKSTDVGIHYADFATACSAGAPATACAPGATRTPRPSGFRPAARSSTTPTCSAVPSTRSPTRDSASRALYKFNDDWNVLITQSYQDMDSQGRVLPAAQRLRWRAAAAARGHAVQPVLRQGQVREHGVDRQRQVRQSEGRLYRRLPGAQRRSGRRLHQLRARRICRLLPVLRSARSGTFVNDPSLKSTCFSPSATWHATERNVHQQHEFRLSTPG